MTKDYELINVRAYMELQCEVDVDCVLLEMLKTIKKHKLSETYARKALELALQIDLANQLGVGKVFDELQKKSLLRKGIFGNGFRD